MYFPLPRSRCAHNSTVASLISCDTTCTLNGVANTTSVSLQTRNSRNGKIHVVCYFDPRINIGYHALVKSAENLAFSFCPPWTAKAPARLHRGVCIVNIRLLSECLMLTSPNPGWNRERMAIEWFLISRVFMLAHATSATRQGNLCSMLAALCPK